MTDQTLTHLYFLLDRSGSMQSIKSDTEGGFAAFVEEQRTAPGRCRVTLAQFDDRYEEVYADRDVADVRPLDLQPRGRTALLDAMGRLVTDAGERLAALPEQERPGTVIVAVMTDGLRERQPGVDPPGRQGAGGAADHALRLAVHVHGRRPGRRRGGHHARRWTAVVTPVAVDNAGNEARTRPHVLRVDPAAPGRPSPLTTATPPPATGWFTQPVQVVVQGRAGDPRVPVRGVRWQIDNGTESSPQRRRPGRAHRRGRGRAHRRTATPGTPRAPWRTRRSRRGSTRSHPQAWFSTRRARSPSATTSAWPSSATTPPRASPSAAPTARTAPSGSTPARRAPSPSPAARSTGQATSPPPRPPSRCRPPECLRTPPPRCGSPAR